MHHMHYCVLMFVKIITAKSNSHIQYKQHSFPAFEWSLQFCLVSISTCLQGRCVSNVWVRLLECMQRPEESTVRKCRKRKILSHLETGEVINEGLASNKQRQSFYVSPLSLSSSFSYAPQKDALRNFEILNSVCLFFHEEIKAQLTLDL